MRIAGIDPGLSGGLAFVGPDGAQAAIMPVIGSTDREIDVVWLANWLRKMRPDVVVIEKVHSMPGQGVKSMFTFGQGYGAVKATCAVLGLPVRLVTPQAWKKGVLAGSKKDKDAAIAWVSQRWPLLDLRPTTRSRKLHDGMADALCLCEWGRNHK